MSSSLLSNSSESKGHDFNAHWYPNNSSSGINESIVRSLLQEQKLEYENKLLGLRQELMSVRTDMLGLKETILKLTDDYNKVRPLVDERRRNALLRKHQPFPFVPEHTRSENLTSSPSAVDLRSERK